MNDALTKTSPILLNLPFQGNDIAHHRQYAYIATSPDLRSTRLFLNSILTRLSVQYGGVRTALTEWLDEAHPHLCRTWRTRAATDEPTPTTDSSRVTGITT